MMRLVFLLLNITFFALLSAKPVYAQEITTSGKFLSDSIKIGQPVAYSFAVRYPQHLTMLFPDSTFDFSPFEFSKKTIFTTQTTHGYSYDSAVYYLQTFEVDKIQYLELPAFLVSARDCTAVYATPDSVFLMELVNSIPDSVSAQNLPLKTNTLYEDVWRQFNYFIILIIVTVLVIAALLIWILFGKRILRHIKMKKLLQKHRQFIQTFTHEIQQLSNAFTSQKAEHTLFLWKKYMEQLERIPYSKLTTREIFQILSDDALGKSLKNIDGAIYGHGHDITPSLQYLQGFAEKQFEKKLGEVKHG
jgi:hypothetical protein